MMSEVLRYFRPGLAWLSAMAIAVLLTTSPVAHAASVTHLTPLDSSGSGIIPYFDPSLGTLDKVHVDFFTEYFLTISGFNDSATPIAGVLEGSGLIELSTAGAPVGGGFPYALPFFADPGPFLAAGPVAGGGGAIFDTPSSVAPFIFTGGFLEFSVSATAFAFPPLFFPGIFIDEIFLTPTGGSAEFKYEFTPAVIPIPAALPLFLSALAGLGLYGWRRHRAAA